MNGTRNNIALLPILVYFVITLLLYSCTDPLGIDDNVLKTPFKVDTIVHRDTIFSVDSIFIVRIDTVIAYKDSIIHKLDTVYIPVDEPTAKRFTPKNVNLDITEKYFKPGNNTILSPWQSPKGFLNVLIDTSYNFPIAFISMNLDNNQNNYNIPGLARQEMAKEVHLRMFGFILADNKPLPIKGSPASNRFGMVVLKNLDGTYRYLTSSDHRFTIEQIDNKTNGKGEIIGTEILIKAEYMSNSLRTNLEVYLDIDF